MRYRSEFYSILQLVNHRLRLRKKRKKSSLFIVCIPTETLYVIFFTRMPLMRPFGICIFQYTEGLPVPSLPVPFSPDFIQTWSFFSQSCDIFKKVVLCTT